MTFQIRAWCFCFISDIFLEILGTFLGLAASLTVDSKNDKWIQSEI